MSVYRDNEIVTNHGKQTISMRVHGLLGFHHKWKLGDIYEPTGDDWVVTHIPTGKLAAHFDTRRQCMHYVKTLGTDKRWEDPLKFPEFIRFVKELQADLIYDGMGGWRSKGDSA